MNKREERALVKETKALIKEVETGNPEHAAWVAIQDRVQRLYEDHTQPEVGGLLDRSERWVRDVLKWNRHTSTGSPFARDARPGRRESVEQAEAKKVLRDPEGRKKVIAALGEEEVTELAQDAWEAAQDKGAARREQEPDPTLTPSKDPVVRGARWELVRIALSQAEGKINDAIRSAQAMDWDDDLAERGMTRVGELEQQLDLLKLAIRKDETVDWDTALAKMEENA